MSRVIIHVKIYPTKECEFTQSIESLIKEFRKEKGCLNYHLKRENENKYCLESEWQSMDELENHFRSHLFSVLLGAMDVLCKSSEVKIVDGSLTMSMEAIEAARRK
jgi:quinol monooxygenase YgiN